jgi:hypothetical protein
MKLLIGISSMLTIYKPRHIYRCVWVFRFLLGQLREITFVCFSCQLTSYLV